LYALGVNQHHGRRSLASAPRRAIRQPTPVTLAGLQVSWALADPGIGEWQVLTAVLEHDPNLLADRPGLGDHR
jgi:hypothetical protein